MATRITEKDLKVLVNRLNAITGQPDVYWGEGHALIGHYYLAGAYKRMTLHQVMNESGGVHSLLWATTKREMLNQLRSLLMGFQIGRAYEQQQKAVEV